MWREREKLIFTSSYTATSALERQILTPSLHQGPGWPGEPSSVPGLAKMGEMRLHQPPGWPGVPSSGAGLPPLQTRPSTEETSDEEEESSTERALNLHDFTTVLQRQHELPQFHVDQN